MEKKRKEKEKDRLQLDQMNQGLNFENECLDKYLETIKNESWAVNSQKIQNLGLKKNGTKLHLVNGDTKSRLGFGSSTNNIDLSLDRVRNNDIVTGGLHGLIAKSIELHSRT